MLRQLRPQNLALTSFCDNDYLGLRNDSRIQHFAAQYDTGGGSSRLISGNHAIYQGLESKLAQVKKTEAALVFSSGYALNSSVIPALVSRHDGLFADKLCHASLIDGMRHSDAPLHRFAHNDIASLERLLRKHRKSYENGFVVTESIFSMDGDRAPMEALAELAERYDCQLVIDDAHGLGFCTLPQGERVIQLGTLSKAVGSLGGYVCGSQLLIDYLTNFGRSLIYSTALPPMVLAASFKALELIEKEPSRADDAMVRASQFAHALDLETPESPIVPYIVGEIDRCQKMSERLKMQGFAVAAIRPPTVPNGTARLRFSFSARHSAAQVDALITAVKQSR